MKNRDEFDSVEDVFQKLKDFAGTRVLTYADADRARVVDGLRKRFRGPDGDAEILVEVRDLPAPSFYRATHCQVWLLPDDLAPPNDNLSSTSCEVQVSSLLAHVWNEIEHDLVYKVLTGQPSQAEYDSLQALGHSIRAGDVQVAQLGGATQARLAALTGVFRNQWDFVARMQPEFPDANDFGTYSGQLFEEFMASGLATPQLVSGLIGGGPHHDAAVQIQAINAFLEEVHDDVVRFEAGTSDELGVLYLQHRADEVIERHPGQGRPPRIASLARRVKWFQARTGG